MSAAPFRQFATATGTAYRQDDSDEGELRRDAALDLLRERRAALVRRGLALTEAELVRLLDVARRRPLLDAQTVRRGKNAGKLKCNL